MKKTTILFSTLTIFCLAIGTAQPAAKLKEFATGVIKKLTPKKAPAGGVQPEPSAPPAEDFWCCPTCTLENEHDAVTCSTCDTPRFAIAANYTAPADSDDEDDVLLKNDQAALIMACESATALLPSAALTITETTDEDLEIAIRRSKAKAHARKEYEEARALKAAAAEKRALEASLSWQCPLVVSHKPNPLTQNYCRDCWNTMKLTIVKPAKRRPLE
ncbi:hypothetical protein FJ365_00775 [Candidatus Dependentiae bacterium]|nr:hypothetical protein [Candidatus Dependentiae bacterium]